MSSKSAEFQSFLADGAKHQAAGRLREAVAAFSAALALAPNHPGALHNLGVVTARLGDHRAALANFDAALAAEPLYASAHYNRAMALSALGQAQEALIALARVTSIDPGHYDAHRGLGFAFLAAGNRGRALDHFTRTYELRRGDDRTGMANRSLQFANKTKLLHDAAQFRHIAAAKRDGKRFEALARNYEAVAENFGAGIQPLSDDDFELLGDQYNTAIHIADAPELMSGVLGERADIDELTRSFADNNGAVYFDHLLGERAFALLQRYLLESTIWHDFSHIDGFVATYLEDGLACPLLLQLVDELRHAFPDLLGAHPLTQAWAFKAVHPNAAVDVHVDDGAVSVNFWMTPGAGNLNPGRGGMTVCRVPPPEDWAVIGYDSDRQRAVAFLEQNRGNCLEVPYGENRAVLFKSLLVHATDAPVFEKSYINHRINVTLLFGPGSSR